MRILVLGEGNAETFDAWSGIAKSLVDHLRNLGHEVITGDVDLYGATRWAAIALAFSPRRFRWWAKYHLTGLPFALRSRRAHRLIERYRDQVDVILRFGATFEPRGRGDLPYAIYCDGNARLAESGETGGQAEMTAFRPREKQHQVAREQRIYDGATVIFTFSERLRRSFLADFHQDPNAVEVVYAGANLDADSIPARRNRDSGEPPTILFVGRAFERKGGDVMLEAFRRVREKIPDAHLTVIGPENLRLEQEGVRNLGFLQKDDPEQADLLRQAYEKADVFCLPTRYEPFGVVFIEAMLHSIPCVGPNAWAVPEIVVDRETGILCPPEDAGAFAAALIELLSNPQLTEDMGEKARERARTWFSWEAVATRITNGLVRSMSGTSSSTHNDNT